MTRKEILLNRAVSPIVGPPPTADLPADLPTDLNGMRALLRTMLGQASIPQGLNWDMSANRSATRITLLEQLVMAKFSDLGPRLALAEAEVARTQAAQALIAADLKLLDAKATLTESATQANAASIVALQKLQTAQEAAQALLQARATASETAIATALQKADAAQFAATAAQLSANTAQAKADADAVAAQAAAATAEAAKTTASQAIAASAAIAGRFRIRQIPTPQVALGGTMTIPVVWETPFADANYNAVAEFEGLSVLGLTAVVTNRTATGCTVTSKNVLNLQLLAAAGLVTVTAIHA